MLSDLSQHGAYGMEYQEIFHPFEQKRCMFLLISSSAHFPTFDKSCSLNPLKTNPRIQLTSLYRIHLSQHDG